MQSESHLTIEFADHRSTLLCNYNFIRELNKQHYRMGKLVNKLFYSPLRVAVDQELRRIIMTQVNDDSLRANLLYHFHLDADVKPTMEFSKRLRAYLCYLFAQESALQFDKIVPLATTMELLHNSTLAIDDVQDKGEIRCGRDSLWKKAGIPSALNAAYFLGLYSLQYYQEKRKMLNFYDHTTIITQFIKRLLCGQQKDLDSCKIAKTISNYYEIAYGKTGALFNMACLLGTMPYSYSVEKSQMISEFANSLAVCYQILDDLNDIKKGVQLDPSNIYFFVSKRNLPVMQNIENLLQIEMNKVSAHLQKLHLAGVLRTNIVDEFISELLNHNGEEV